jgi:hypothetical protein
LRSNLFTAGGVTAGIDFGLTVVAELLGEAQAQTIQLAHEYAPEPPFRAGTPETAPPAVIAAAKERVASPRKARVTGTGVESGRALGGDGGGQSMPAKAGIACWTKLEITPPSISNHSRYGTLLGFPETQMSWRD